MTNQFERAIGYSKNWTEFISTGGFPFTSCSIINPESLATQLFSCASEKFTGCLDIEAPQHQHWSLYFCQGLICGGSGIHPRRSWLRQLYRYCPQLIKDTTVNDSNQIPSDNYDALVELVRRGKISQAQMTEVVESYILEIFFDLIQHLEQMSHPSNWQLSYSQIPQDQMDSALVTIEVDEMWRQAVKLWRSWQSADLADISPNLAPTVLKPQELQQQFSQMLYGNLSGLGGINQAFKALQEESSQFTSDKLIASMDGNQTLRDLAVHLNRNLLLLTQPIVPYIRQGLVELNPVEDMSLIASPIKLEHSSTETPATAIELKPTNPLIACIEDSSVDLLLMNHILTQAGYQFINVEDQEKALSILIEHKPDLIFLDLVMPIANGYEICSQIRRVSFFKSTPVIILTGKDGIIDRTRAKIVGASDFITKPINKDKMLQALYTYLPKPKVNQFQDTSMFGDWYVQPPMQYSPM